MKINKNSILKMVVSIIIATACSIILYSFIEGYAQENYHMYLWMCLQTNYWLRLIATIISLAIVIFTVLSKNKTDTK